MESALHSLLSSFQWFNSIIMFCIFLLAEAEVTKQSGNPQAIADGNSSARPMMSVLTLVISVVTVILTRCHWEL